MTERRRTAVLLAAGSGRRVGGDVKKQYIEIGGIPLFIHAVRAMMGHPAMTDGVLVVPAGDEAKCGEILAAQGLEDRIRAIVPGGAERYHSVACALDVIDWPCDQAFIHDCARPLIDADAIDRLCASLEEHVACVAGVPAKDTIKIADADCMVQQTPDRSRTWVVQTPQAFAFPMIRDAYRALVEQERDLAEQGITITDDAMVVEQMTDHRVRMVEASYRNIKVTTKEDIVIAEALMGVRPL